MNPMSFISFSSNSTLATLKAFNCLIDSLVSEVWWGEKVDDSFLCGASSGESKPAESTDFTSGS